MFNSFTLMMMMMRSGKHATVHTRRSKDNFVKSFLTFHLSMGSGRLTWLPAPFLAEASSQPTDVYFWLLRITKGFL